MARSSVTLEEYRYEIKIEVGVEQKREDLPDNLVNTWIHKDICETVLKLGSVINQAYRAIAPLSVGSNSAHSDATITHSSGSTSVTGFTGLTPDAWIGGTIIAVVSSVLYTAQITDNDATTLTISLGTALPVMSDDPGFLVVNGGSIYTIALTSLSMIHYADPIWMVRNASDSPVPKINVDLAQNIPNIPQHDDEVYWYLVGQTIHLVPGASATPSGEYDVGYYVLPTEATSNSDTIDLPLEWHDLAQQRTMVRILKKINQYNAASQKEDDLARRHKEIIDSNLNMMQVDQMYNERK